MGQAVKITPNSSRGVKTPRVLLKFYRWTIQLADLPFITLTFNAIRLPQLIACVLHLVGPSDEDQFVDRSGCFQHLLTGSFGKMKPLGCPCMEQRETSSSKGGFLLLHPPVRNGLRNKSRTALIAAGWLICSPWWHHALYGAVIPRWALQGTSF